MLACKSQPSASQLTIPHTHLRHLCVGHSERHRGSETEGLFPSPPCMPSFPNTSPHPAHVPHASSSYSTHSVARREVRTELAASGRSTGYGLRGERLGRERVAGGSPERRAAPGRIPIHIRTMYVYMFCTA